MSAGTPVVIAAPAGECLGWFHEASAPSRSVAVVMCRPLGYEALCSYRTYTQLAHSLSAAGFDVLRFDYHGTGDSTGGDLDSDRVGAWLGSVESAVAAARELSGARDVALFGMRLGATLALEAAQHIGGVASMMLWAPCANGRAFTREMRAAFASHANAALELDGGLEALGTLFTRETLLALDGLAPATANAPPAKRVLLIGRDDMPAPGPLPAQLRASGAEVTELVWPGYAAMMAEPHDAKLTPQTLEAITAWLSDAHPAFHTTTIAHDAVAPAQGLRNCTVSETPASFGHDGRLFGVLSQAATPRDERSQTAVLLLNVGGNYRVGPNRVYVKLARDLAAAGYRALRMDVSGIGDSRLDEGFSSDRMYRGDATADVSAAIDMLLKRGCTRIFLLGICSGAYLAFQTALQDTRVNGQVIINARLLEWDADKHGPWQSSMQQYYKSTRYYRQALLHGDVYARLLRGEVDVRGIARRLRHLAAARVRRLVDRIIGRPPQEGVLAKMKHLCGRGVDTLVTMSEQDDGLDYMEFHLGTRGAGMRGHANFRMELVPDADHTFSTVAGQRALTRIVREHLDGLHAQAEPAVSGLAPPVAIT